jgi:hypothetical protein
MTRSHARVLRASMLLALLLTILPWPQPANAFDAGPHWDLTVDALRAEGFNDTAAQVVQVTNWMTDFYEQASANPFSGHSAWWKELLSGAYGWREHWPDSIVNAADWLHFDSTPHFLVAGIDRRLDSGQTLELEWDRLARASRTAARERAAAGDTLGLLAVIGVSCHAVQDFYAHSNWVEPAGTPGYDGPGWAALTVFGSNPTWFDVPAQIRSNARVYSNISVPPRSHGTWNSDGNANLSTAVNKDWPGRPLYRDAYITAYFATRQWLQALRGWVADDASWRAAMSYSDRHGDQLDRDVSGAFSIQFNAGHLQGQGEPAGADAPGPGGSLDDLIGAIGNYHRAGKTVFRAKFEEVVPSIARLDPPTVPAPVASSYPLQAATDFVALKVTHVHDNTGASDVGIDPGVDEADFYARMFIAGQRSISGMIHGYDSFDFRSPNYPFTFIKAVPRTWQTSEPVTALAVTVSTSGASLAGTDDNVYLRVNDSTRFQLDKPLYDDFERGDLDTYSLNPPVGMHVQDIQYIQIEKDPDGVNGGWKLYSVGLYVNRKYVYGSDKIDRWLEDDHRTWRAANFRPLNTMTADVPVTLEMWDSDGGFYGDDDHCDINGDFNRYDLNLLYNRDTGAYRGDLTGVGTGNSHGGSANGGRGADDDNTAVSFALETYRVSTAAGGSSAGGSTAPTGYFSLQSYNYPQYYVRRRNYLGELTQILSDLDRKDATFKIVPGLADGRCMSFESRNFPGYYLRHQDYQVKLASSDGSSLFREDATFCNKPGLADSAGTSFESLNHPGYYLRHRNFKLYLEQGADKSFREDATFKLTAPLG